MNLGPVPDLPNAVGGYTLQPDAIELWASVMIEKFARSRGWGASEFLDLNHTSNAMILVSLLIPKFARDTCIEVRRTSESGH